MLSIQLIRYRHFFKRKLLNYLILTPNFRLTFYDFGSKFTKFQMVIKVQVSDTRIYHGAL